ncbi:translocating chain-associated membrane protein 1 isoform X1 [Dermacentor albipictus]|uniref:translocating chain-associated membrane protein 1 isoform X1 n=1 Tax=Dermacentor albipictus TaxID=60249 RepID=UPI001897385C
MALKRRTGSKNPPIFSHEFVIQNHADIVSCVAMLFVMGLLFQVTAPYASVFIAVHHNTTDGMETQGIVNYTYGAKDICLTFFYFLIAIVMHAIIQEYLLDYIKKHTKLNRKMHLSKMKHSKFNESGQLLIFCLASFLWGAEIIRKEGYLPSINKLWEGYPHNEMSFMFKFYFIIQLAYWLHCYPELYFQKTKKDEMSARITTATLPLIFFLVSYVLNFSRIALCLSVMHYLVETVFHASRLLLFAERTKAADYGYAVWNVLFVLVRLASITLSVLTFWYGLAQQENAALPIGLVTGNFNTKLIRVNCTVAVCLLQAWMMWNFVNFHLQLRRERAEAQQSSGPAAKKKAVGRKDRKAAKKDESTKRAADEDVNELPEVDQNAKKELRSRHLASPKAKRS